MNQSTISIIVPAYNIAPYLPRCLESLTAQAHRHLEIIVIDDGSTDETGAIIDDWTGKDSRIKAIHKENGGVSSARLAGIAAAKGEWIGFVDGDDFAEPEMFAHLLKNALEHDVDISHCGYQMVFPDGHIDMYYNTGRKDLFDHDTGLEALIRGEYLEPGLCNKLYRRQLFDGLTDWLDLSIRFNEDLLMNYYLFSRAEFSYYEDLPLYHYMLRKGSASTSKPQRFKITDPVRVMESILAETVGKPALYRAAAERYLRVLIGTAQQRAWPDEAVAARQKLKDSLRRFRSVNVSEKVRLMAFGVAYLTPLYLLVRRIYDRVTGINKKYDLE